MGLLHPHNLCKEGKIKFDILWEEYVQEESRVANREALLRDDDHALVSHARRRRGKPHFKKETHKESHPPKNF